MVQDIREPHNADQVIGHLDNANNLIVLLLQRVRNRFMIDKHIWKGVVPPKAQKGIGNASQYQKA